MLATTLLASAPVALALSVMAPSRPLTPRENLEVVVEASQVVTLARVTSAKSTSTVGHGGQRFDWLLELEPIEYFKGGIDGDRIEVLLSEPSMPSIPSPGSIAQITGKATWAAVFFLRASKGTWTASTGTTPDRSTSIRAEQAGWKAVSDSLRDIVNAMSLDSTLSRSDVVAVVHRAASKSDPSLVTLVPDAVLAGSPKPGGLKVRTRFGLFPAGQHVVCLELGKDGVYEPIPFARTVLSTSDGPDGKPVLSDSRLNEVKEILARVRPTATKVSKP